MFFEKDDLNVFKVLFVFCMMIKEIVDLREESNSSLKVDGILFWSTLKTRVANFFFDGVFTLLGSFSGVGIVILDEDDSFVFTKMEPSVTFSIEIAKCLASYSGKSSFNWRI